MTVDLAIKIGTANTSIYLGGSGLVLKEPSFVAFTGSVMAKNLRAVGKDAFDMLGRAPEKTIICAPIEQGIIVDMNAAEIMLKEFLKKVVEKSFFSQKIRALLCIPCGLDLSERQKYSEICFNAGIKDLTIIESIITAAVGIDLPVCTSFGGVVVNIGGGVCDVAALSLSGIINGVSVNVGGTVLDAALIDLISAKYGLKIGEITAQKVKHEIGSLFEKDVAAMDVSGVDLRTKNPSSVTVRASDTKQAYLNYFLTITDTIEHIVNSCPPEIAADIYRTGIHVTGGSALIAGLSDLFKEKLRLPVTIAENAQNAVILGAGKLLSNQTLLQEIIEQN